MQQKNRKTILLIEDNDDIRENTAEILALSNYKVIMAENGKKGVEEALKYSPDLIICDIMMPGLDGYGVLHAVHRNESVKNTPFIFLTAKTERTDFRKGMELGADDYITKPFDGTELLKAVDSRLKKMDLLRESFSPGLDGLQTIVTAAGGNNSLKNFTEDRNTNSYRKKQIIYSEGNHPNSLFYVIKGKVKTYRTHEDGKDLVTGLSSPGDFFGYVALLQGRVYMDTAEAIEDAELAIIPKQDFEDLINYNLEVTKKFIQLLAKNVTEKEDQLLGFAYNSLRKKVAEALMMLQKKYQDKDGTLAIDISRENLASIAGTATESLIRTLSDFKSERLIEIKQGNITVLDLKRLQSLIN